jgi:hypothetical protein
VLLPSLDHSRESICDTLLGITKETAHGLKKPTGGHELYTTCPSEHGPDLDIK